MKQLQLMKRLSLLCLKKKIVGEREIGQAYSAISEGYEALFLQQMHGYNDRLLAAFAKEVPKSATHLLDLACGTGYNSMQLKKRYQATHFCLVDLSEGMLGEAKKKALDLATYVQADMLGFLKQQASGSFDGVVCCWAIKYQSPEKIVKEVYRVLKPGGVFGVIVNTKGTLPEIRKIYPKLLLAQPQAIQKIMLELPNPKDKKGFEKWFTKAGFKTLRVEAGHKVFTFKGAADLTKWVTHTGALAGFDCMIDLKSEAVQQKMCALLKEEKIQQVTHSFVWGIFKKEEREGIQ